MSRNYLRSAIIVSMLIFFATGCNLSNPTPISQQMGTIKIVNNHIRGSDSFPGGTGLPDAREVGVCIINYPPVAGITKPAFDVISARDAQTTTFTLPAGTYSMQEWQFDSEISADPQYSPAVKHYVRTAENVVLETDATIAFGSERTLPAPGDFVEGELVNSICGEWLLQAGGSFTSTPTFSNEGRLPTSIHKQPTNTPVNTVEEEIFSVRSHKGVFNGVTIPTTFTITESWLLASISTYHWNNQQGATPGTIGLKDANGVIYGPWQASGISGQGGVPNAYWTAYPDTVIPAGTYTVIDSDPATWAQNSETSGAGMAWGSGFRQGNP
jgi:hypothetical protein